MANVPADRAALFQVIADVIGWGASADDVADIAEEIEAQGVRFTTADPTAAMVTALVDGMHAGAAPALAAAMAASPYAPGKP